VNVNAASVRGSAIRPTVSRIFQARFQSNRRAYNADRIRATVVTENDYFSRHTARAQLRKIRSEHTEAALNGHKICEKKSSHEQTHHANILYRDHTVKGKTRSG
jgi:hypothetical protein